MSRQDNEAQLDQLLGQLSQAQATAPGHLAQKILANLPQATTFERFTLWLTSNLWRPVVTAAIPLLLGFVAGVSGSNPGLDDASMWYAAEDLIYTNTLQEYDYDEI